MFLSICATCGACCNCGTKAELLRWLLSDEITMHFVALGYVVLFPSIQVHDAMHVATCNITGEQFAYK